MKKVGMVAVHILMLGVLASANANSLESRFPASASAAWMQQKTIKDPAEYNEYISALNMTDPTAKAAAMETFAGKYPASVVRTDALEQAMAAYQQAGNLQKVEQTASHILELDPNNIRALAVAAFLARAGATAGNTVKLKDVCADSQKGIQSLPAWPSPDGMSEADFAALRNQMAGIFYGGAGFCALQNKDYPMAGANYLKAVQLNPGDVQDLFQFSIAQLESKPLDLNGFWYCGKAISVAQSDKNDTAGPGMTKYCKARYRKYHGSEDGWDKMLVSIAAQNAPPSGFAATIKSAPTPAEIACQAVQENDPSDLSFSDWEFVLQLRDSAPCNLESANKVWKAIQDKQKQGQAKLQIAVKVISVSGNTINAAITDENQQANQADLKVIMQKPLLKSPVPASMINVIGVLTKYEVSPFFFQMDGDSFKPVVTGQK